MSASIDKNKKVDVDLFTLDIVRDSLLAIGEEMVNQDRKSVV